MIRILVIPALIVLAAIFGAATLLATAPELDPEAPAPVPLAVRVLTVEPQSVQLQVHSQGTVEPRTESALIPEVSGRVEWLSPAMVSGGRFNAGEALLRIEQVDYRTALTRAQAQFTSAEAELENARFEYERLKPLQDKKLVSASALEAAQRRYRIAEASRADAEAAVTKARRDLERTELTAPYNGIVRTESVDVGQFVNRGNEIARVYATDLVEVRLPIADEQLAYLNLPLGMRSELSDEEAPEVTLSADFAGQHYDWQGRVVRTEGEIDPRSRMVHVVARVQDADPPIPVGLFVNASIAGNQVQNVVTLPRSALRSGNQVLVVDAENKLYFRAITPLRFYRDQVIIRSGLAAGERVCISPVQTVVEGMTVAPIASGSTRVAATN